MKNKKNQSSNNFTSGDHEFYRIPVIGEVHITDNEWETSRKFSLGELIQNFKQEDRRTIIVRALDHALSGEGIFKGDMLTVNLKKRPKDGDIAAVKFGDKLFIRKIYFQKNLIRLDTSADQPAPVIIDERTPDVMILGKVTMVVREL